MVGDCPPHRDLSPHRVALKGLTAGYEPNNHHWEALVELANSLVPGHLFTD